MATSELAGETAFASLGWVRSATQPVQVLVAFAIQVCVKVLTLHTVLEPLPVQLQVLLGTLLPVVGQLQ